MAKKTLSMKDRLLRTLETSGDNKIKTGFTDIDVWCAMPNYAMNRRWSGKWDKAFLFGRNYVMYGESGCLPKTSQVRIRKRHKSE